MTFLLVLIFCNKFYSLEAHVLSNESTNAKIIKTNKSNFWFTDFEVLASVGPPEFRCASVDDLGDVVLSWIPVNDPLGIFIEYRIYSAIGGVFSLIGTESNVSTSSFTHLGANANSASVTYYISAVSNSSGSIVEDSSIDTLSTLFLNVVNPSNGTAVLQWNSITNPVLSTAYSHHYIYMEYPSGTWNLIDSVPNSVNYFADTITICDAFLNFRIGLLDQYGCMSFSNVEGDQFQDMLPPDVPVINSVSIDTSNGNVILNWDSTYFEDTYAYIIFQNINGSWEVIDTVYGYSNTTYVNSISSNSSFQVDNYGVAAYDSCLTGNPNTSPVSDSHNTILLANELDVCDLSVNLSWNSYGGWSSGVSSYSLYCSKNSGPWTLISQLNPSINNYIYQNLDGLSNYQFLIKASENGSQTSLSNISNLFVYQPPQPAFSYLKSVDVVDENLVEVQFHADNSIAVYGYELLRSDDGGANFDYVDFSSSIINPVIFQDDQVETSIRSYQYKVQVIDSCNRISSKSNTANTILLNAQANMGLSNDVLWNGYLNWDGGVSSYDVYRMVNGVYEVNPIVSLNSALLSFSDDISNFIGSNSDGQFCYKIKAVEQLNSFGFAAESYSNEFCANQEPIVFAPNSFTPNSDGINDRWKPIVNLLDFSDYRVYVYNRLNQLVFESSDAYEYWNGGYLNNAKIVPVGVYLYFIEFKNGRGDFLREQGYITVIK